MLLFLCCFAFALVTLYFGFDALFGQTLFKALEDLENELLRK